MDRQNTLQCGWHWLMQLLKTAACMFYQKNLILDTLQEIITVMMMMTRVIPYLVLSPQKNLIKTYALCLAHQVNLFCLPTEYYIGDQREMKILHLRDWHPVSLSPLFRVIQHLNVHTCLQHRLNVTLNARPMKNPNINTINSYLLLLFEYDYYLFVHSCSFTTKGSICRKNAFVHVMTIARNTLRIILTKHTGEKCLSNLSRLWKSGTRKKQQKRKTTAKLTVLKVVQNPIKREDTKKKITSQKGL